MFAVVDQGFSFSVTLLSIEAMDLSFKSIVSLSGFREKCSNNLLLTDYIAYYNCNQYPIYENHYHYLIKTTFQGDIKYIFSYRRFDIL